MINHNINPTIIELFGFELRWYGLAYVFGMLLTVIFIKYVARKLKTKEVKFLLKEDNYLDLVLYVVLGGILGGRVFYFVFYNFSNLINDFFELFRVWNGGMSFHGGLIGAMIGLFIYSKKNKKDFFLMADILVIPAALSLFFGRIANFVNGELYGRLYDGALCINYESSKYLLNPPEGCRYPSQIVEALKNLVIFLTLFFSFKKIDSKNYKTGTLASIFVFMYGLFRFFIEYIRQPDEQVGFLLLGLTMGQMLCVAMMATAIVFFIYRYEKLKRIKVRF